MFSSVRAAWADVWQGFHIVATVRLDDEAGLDCLAATTTIEGAFPVNPDWRHPRVTIRVDTPTGRRILGLYADGTLSGASLGDDAGLRNAWSPCLVDLVDLPEEGLLPPPPGTEFVPVGVDLVSPTPDLPRLESVGQPEWTWELFAGTSPLLDAQIMAATRLRAMEVAPACVGIPVPAEYQPALDGCATDGFGPECEAAALPVTNLLIDMAWKRRVRLVALGGPRSTASDLAETLRAACSSAVVVVDEAHTGPATGGGPSLPELLDQPPGAATVMYRTGDPVPARRSRDRRTPRHQ